LPEALRYLSIATEFNRDRRDNEGLAALREDVQSIIEKTYLKSWWFRITVLLLGAAVIFALWGDVKLQGYSLDVRKDVKDAKEKIEADKNQVDADVKDAKEKIQADAKQVQADIVSIGTRVQANADEASQRVEKKLDSQLASFLENARHRIDNGAEAHLETLKQTTSPALKSGLQTLQSNVVDLEKQNTQLRDDAASLRSTIDLLSEDLTA
jgi:chromosome segregation ATPase